MIKYKISHNAYIVDVPKNLRISTIFNAEYISLYYLPMEPKPESILSWLTIVIVEEEKIESVMVDHIILNYDKSEYPYLVKWQH